MPQDLTDAALAEKFANFLERAAVCIAQGPAENYTHRVLAVDVEDQCDEGATFPHDERFTLDADEIRQLLIALRAGQDGAVRAGLDADTPRDTLMGMSLRQYAHDVRREACGAWSDVRDMETGNINEAKCNYASAQEKRLTSAIDELANLHSEQGTVRVPVEPTAEMLKAAWNAAIHGRSPAEDRAVWRAMLLAAPRGQEQIKEPVRDFRVRDDYMEGLKRQGLVAAPIPPAPSNAGAGDDLWQAAKRLASAYEMEEHNEAIFSGKWKKGSKSWSGSFIDSERKAAIAEIRAALIAAPPAAPADAPVAEPVALPVGWRYRWWNESYERWGDWRFTEINNAGTPHEKFQVEPLYAAPPGWAEGVREGIYVASRVKHAPMWQRYREAGFPIVSTWIDEAGDDETDDFGELWQRITTEIRSAAALVFFANHDDFPLKGALVEVGIALAAGTPVYVVSNATIEGRTMRPLGSWILSRHVTRIDSLDKAMELAARAGGK